MLEISHPPLPGTPRERQQNQQTPRAQGPPWTPQPKQLQNSTNFWKTQPILGETQPIFEIVVEFFAQTITKLNQFWQNSTNFRRKSTNSRTGLWCPRPVLAPAPPPVGLGLSCPGGWSPKDPDLDKLLHRVWSGGMFEMFVSHRSSVSKVEVCYRWLATLWRASFLGEVHSVLGSPQDVGF